MKYKNISKHYFVLELQKHASENIQVTRVIDCISVNDCNDIMGMYICTTNNNKYIFSDLLQYCIYHRSDIFRYR